MDTCNSPLPSTQHMPREVRIILVVMNVLVAISNVIINSFLMHVLKRTRQTKHVTFKFIFCLCISDCLVGLTLQPLLIYVEGFGNGNCGIEYTIEAIGFLVPQFSAIMIMAVSLDRYLHMKFLHDYPRYMNPSRAKQFIAGGFLLSLATSVTAVLLSMYGNYFFFKAGFIFLNLLILISVVIMYIATYTAIRKQVGQLDMDTSKAPSSSGNQILTHQQSVYKSRLSSRSQFNNSLTKTTIFILLSLAICYLPYLIVSFPYAYAKFHLKKEPRPIWGTLLYWSLLPSHFNSSLNAVILIFCNKAIKRLITVFLRGSLRTYVAQQTSIRNSEKRKNHGKRVTYSKELEGKTDS